MCDTVCKPSGSQMLRKNYWPKLEVKNYKMELLLRYVWRVVDSDPNIDFKETLKKWVPYISTCGCGTQDKNLSLQDKLVCSLLKLWQNMGGGLTENDISYLLVFIERTRTEKIKLNFSTKFNCLKMRYKVNYLKEQEIPCTNAACVKHLRELENLLVSIPEVNLEDAVNNIRQEKNGYCVKGLGTLDIMENDVELQINELESGDGEYMGMLTQADEMWIEMENAFQKSIEVTKEMENTLSTELHLVELSLSKWKEKCAITEEDEKKAIEINEELQTEIDENTRQSQVLDQELVELSSLAAQVNNNLKIEKNHFAENMQKLRTEKENYLKNICCLEDELKEKQICGQKKCQAFNEKILDARHELAKCCKYFLQQSQQREELRQKAKYMNNGKITCAKRCLESKDLIDSQKQKIISEISEMRDNKAKTFPAYLGNNCNCDSSTNNCNCEQCKQQICTYCCCADLKNQFFRNILKDVLMRLRACSCDVDSGFVGNLNSVLQCNTSPINEKMLLKTFLLDLVCGDLDISVSEGLQLTREKVPIKTRANVRECLGLSEEQKIIEDNEGIAKVICHDEFEDEMKYLDLKKKMESNKGLKTKIYEDNEVKPESLIEDIESVKIEVEIENEDLEPVKADLESQYGDLEPVKADIASLNPDLESVQADLESQNEDLASLKTEFDLQNEDLEVGKIKFQSESEKSEAESQIEQLQSNNAEAEFQPEDVGSVEIKSEFLQEVELGETVAATKSYLVEDDLEKVAKAHGSDQEENTCSKCSIPSNTRQNDTELKKCPVEVTCDNLLRPTNSNCLDQRNNKKKRVEKKLDTCNCMNNQNVFMKNKLVVPKTCIPKHSQTGRMQNVTCPTYQENSGPEIAISKHSYCSCMSEFRKNDFEPKKTRSCRKNITSPTNIQGGKYNVSSMYFDILAKTKRKDRNFSLKRCPYDKEYKRESFNQKLKHPLDKINNSPNFGSKRNISDNEGGKMIKNDCDKNKTIKKIKRCLQAPLIGKLVPRKQKCKAVNTEMTCKNVIKKGRVF